MESIKELDIEELFVNVLTIQQGSIYVTLAQNNPSQRKFIKGWINRLKMKVNLEFPIS